MSTYERSFERQVAAFLGGMAEELPSGRGVPPRAMLRRAHVHMTATAVAGAVFVAITIVLGTLATRGLLGGHGSFPAPSLIGGAGLLGDGTNGGRGTNGRGTLGAIAGAPGQLAGVEGSYERSAVRSGPDGGSWGGPAARGPKGRVASGRTQQSGTGGDASGGGRDTGGTGWEPPPIWIGGSAGSFPPAPDPGLPSFGGVGGAIGDGVAPSGDAKRTGPHGGHRHHRRDRD